MMMCASNFLFSDFAFEEDAFFNLVTFALPLFLKSTPQRGPLPWSIKQKPNLVILNLV